MPKVLISDKMDPKAAQIFRERGVEVDEITGKTPDELKAIIGQYDGLAIRSSTKVTKDILEHATNLKVVGRAGIGVDNVDIPAATAKGVVVMNTPFGNSITTAEHAIALMFALARQLPEADASTQAGKWEKNRFMGVELTAKTLGLIGAGNIGSIVADRLRRTDPAGRLIVVIFGATVPIPFLIGAFTASSVWVFYPCLFLSGLTASGALGSAAATTQDLVLPRMRGTATATFFIGTTLMGLAMGPYLAGRISTLSGSLSVGMLSLLAIMPVALTCAIAAYRLVPAAEASREARARAAGEPI